MNEESIWSRVFRTRPSESRILTLDAPTAVALATVELATQFGVQAPYSPAFPPPPMTAESFARVADDYYRQTDRRINNPKKTEPAAGPTLTVEEIHRDFDNAAERFVEEAKGILAKHETGIAKRLQKLGFVAHPSVVEVEKDFELRSKVENAEPFIALYKEKYGKKFITWDLAQALAKKYGLVLGRVNQYIGRVPEANLIDIEEFAKVFHNEDYAYCVLDPYGNIRPEWGFNPTQQYSPYQKLTNDIHIVAPMKDFKSKLNSVQDNVLIHDPIVLWPAVGGFIIVTAWGGPEAEDPLVRS